MLNNKVSKAVRLAIAFGAASTAAFSACTFAAQATDEQVERIEVTGSAIKRTDMEGALPVQVISRAEIEKTGVTNVPDLIQQIPAMQGFTTSSDSVGGSGGGISSASIHDIGEQYTLVLLNGRRLAPADSAGTIDLNSIPFSAIERVEILTDGASALYGSDAIAGVLNFILKSSVDETHISARYDKPQEDGGNNWSLSLTTGFGNLDRDGYSFVLSASHEEQEQLAALDRDFAKTGILSFENQGRDLYFFNGSPNAIPANARIRYTDDETGEQVRATFNPYRNKTGNCAEANSAILAECFFDYTTTIEIIPENERTSLMLNGEVSLSDDITGFATVAYTNNKMTARIAPYPTGYFNLPTDSSLVATEVLPYLPDDLSATEVASIDQFQARWRALPAGNRTTEYDTDSTHLVVGARGFNANIDWEGALTYSKNERNENYPTGWLLAEPFVNAVSNGDINVFVPSSEVDDSSREALSNAVYSGNWEKTEVVMTGADLKGSMPIFELPDGAAYLAVGADYRNYEYTNDITDANANEEILFLSKGTDYDLERSQYGVFAELVMPVIENVELSASARYDDIDGVKDNLVGSNVDEGNSDTTYKFSARWQATEDLLLRGSVGTGFKAPSLLSIARPRVPFGVTGGNYECPFPAGDELAAYCLTGRTQYGVFVQGNPNVKFETSDQYTVGFVYAPTNEFSIQMDYWKVELEDLITSLTEAQIFDGAEKYRELFTTRTNLATGDEELAIIQSSVNVGKSVTSGIDWHVGLTNDLSFGTLKTNWTGTYLIKNEYTRPGTNDDWITSLGQFGDNDAVSFRVKSQISSTLSHGDFAHTLRASYQSGYQDQLQTAETCSVTEVDAFGECVQIQLRVPSYTLIDYQTKYDFMDNASITFGINNLFDKQPPMSLRTGGAGHQVGFDPRYFDAYGRTFYLQADYSF